MITKSSTFLEIVNRYEFKRIFPEFYLIKIFFDRKFEDLWSSKILQLYVTNTELSEALGEDLECNEEESYSFIEEFPHLYSTETSGQNVIVVMICSSRFLKLTLQKLASIKFSNREVQEISKNHIHQTYQNIKTGNSSTQRDIEQWIRIYHDRASSMKMASSIVRKRKNEICKMLLEFVTEFNISPGPEETNFFISVPKKFESDWRRELSKIKCTGKECRDAQEFF